MTTSAPPTASLAEPAALAPASTTGRNAAALRSKALTWSWAFRRFLAIGPPMLPTPTKAILAIRFSPLDHPVYRTFRGPQSMIRAWSMGKSSVLGALVVAAVLGPAGTAAGISPKDVSDCVGGAVDSKIAACSRLVQSHSLDKSNLGAVYFDRANAYRDKGSMDLAIADYGSAISFRPDLAPAYNSRGALLLDRGDTQHALADFDNAIRLKPDFADALLNRGAARAAQHDYARAVSYYDASLKLRPGDVRALLNRGIAHGEQRNYPAALADFNEVIRLTPEGSEGYSGRCWIRAASGNAPEAAVEDCNRAVRLNPHDSAVIGYRALLALRLGDFDAAIVDYDRGLSTAPRNAAFLFGRGIAKLRAGNPTGAKEDLATAKALDPRIAQTYAGYGIAP